jgi:hypothetical protein
MTTEEIHQVIVKLSDHIEEVLTVIKADQPQDGEGFPQIADQDLADAVTTLDYASSCLSRLAYKIAREAP